MIKILIADDQELIRESLKIVLDMNKDMEVIGLAENGHKVLDLLKKTVPDIILMDIRMPELDGVLCTKAVKEKYSNVKIIILTTFDDDEYVYYALKYGASGYLLKGCSVQELTAAIHKVMSGSSILNPNVINKVVKLFNQLAQTNIAMEVDEKDVKELSKTERNIAHFVGHGLSNKEISEKLSLSEGTVRNGLSSALSKLHLRDRTQLAIWAVQTGLALRIG
ncbi:MAG: response regulator transcription factor [Selenomonadaceae bacterium]|nr:response regulator transcription factor [Selenomonadaceae bacterium]MBR1858476.1 response regulator transcription factor [Selenomonadaceae bacterium]